MSETGIRYEVEGNLARITLARPQASNALDLVGAQALRAAVDAASDHRVQAVLVRGEGKRFCAGGDVRSMINAADRGAHVAALAGEVSLALTALTALEKPVVAAVHGAVAGAGLALMLSCDLVIAARSTVFVTAYAGIGLTPDCGLSYLLPRAIGQQRALDFLLTGRVLDADTALAWGLVTEVVDGDDATEVASGLAARLAAGPVFALGQAKRLSRSAWAAAAETSWRDEVATIARATSTPDAVGLIEAFGQRGPATQ